MATKLDLARAQFDGYYHAHRGYSLKSLVESMGLKKTEWEKLRSLVPLNNEEIKAIDYYLDNQPKH